MLKSLHKLLASKLSAQGDEQDPVVREHAIQVATGALLVELSRADFRENVVESETIYGLLKTHFELSGPEAESLLQRAEDKSDEVVSLYELTRLLNDELSEQERCHVVGLMWQVALADEHLHSHEDHLVRKVAELLYVPRSQMMRLRHEALKGVGEPGGS